MRARPRPRVRARVRAASLATYVVVLSTMLVYSYLTPPDAAWHVLVDPLRLALAAAVTALLGWLLYRCGTSEVCAGVLPLIMMMPGATTGAVLIVLAFVATVLLPLTTDMLSAADPRATPVPVFLILPCLCCAVLFWGMSAHWVTLLCDGLSQKMWLKSKGYKRPRKPGQPPDAAALV